jgi:hypothetical protein
MNKLDDSNISIIRSLLNHHFKIVYLSTKQKLKTAEISDTVPSFLNDDMTYPKFRKYEWYKPCTDFYL